MSGLDSIKREAGVLEKESAVSAEAHFINSRKWLGRNLYIGLPSTLLAAVAGVAAFGEMDKGITGGVAMAVAALTAINTFLNPADRASAHRMSSTSFGEIRRNANLLKDVHADLVDETDGEAIRELVGELEALSEKLTQTDQAAPSLPEAVLRSARAKVKEAGGI